MHSLRGTNLIKRVNIRCMSSDFVAPGLRKIMREKIEDKEGFSSLLGGGEGEEEQLSGILYYFDIPATYVQEGLNYAHITTGLPWWLTIVSSTVLLRASLFPLAVYSNHNMLRYSKIAHDINYLHSLMKMSMANLPLTDVKGRMEKYLLYRKGRKIIQTNNSASPYKNLLAPLIHLPIWLTFAWGVRGLLVAKVSGCMSGGSLWFTDLTVEDPTLILPFLAVASTYTGMHVLTANSRTPTVWYIPRLFDTLQMGLLCATPFIAKFPLGIFMYWITNAVWGIGQTLAFQNDSFRVSLGLNPLPLPPREEAVIDSNAAILASKPSESARNPYAKDGSLSQIQLPSIALNTKIVIKKNEDKEEIENEEENKFENKR